MSTENLESLLIRLKKVSEWKYPDRKWTQNFFEGQKNLWEGKEDELKERVRRLEEQKRLTWKKVLDCKKEFGHVDKFINQVVIPSGYKFFIWNNRIYELFDNDDYEDTGLIMKKINQTAWSR